jgi:ABC-type multidrug transport system ATPase subunit
MLICALLGNPAVLILDEPLDSLDMETVLLLKDALLNLKTAQSHILISSHIPEFVDEYADQVILLDHGHIAEVFRPEDHSTAAMYRQIFMTP